MRRVVVLDEMDVEILRLAADLFQEAEPFDVRMPFLSASDQAAFQSN